MKRTLASDVKVSVASFKETSLKNTPSIITVLTKDDIFQSGARDIVDLLRLVPGLDFAQNYDLAAGLCVRGNWAEEGKFLLLLDGQILNDSGFGTIIFTQRIPLNNIERIEIIRGAGSSIYGGLAGLSVINIISRKASDFQGILLNSYAGFATDNFVKKGRTDNRSRKTEKRCRP